MTVGSALCNCCWYDSLRGIARFVRPGAVMLASLPLFHCSSWPPCGTCADAAEDWLSLLAHQPLYCSTLGNLYQEHQAYSRGECQRSFFLFCMKQ